MSIRLTFGGALAVFAVAAGLRAEADTAKRQMTVDDLYLIQDVSGPALSPDGKLVAYVVTGHDTEIDAAISDIWMVDYKGATPHQITAADDKSESTPKFSPDGRFLAYVGEDEDDGSSQVFIRTLKGGKTRQASDVVGGIIDFDWSPDSKRMLITAFMGGAEPNEAGTEPPIVIDRFQFMEDWTGYLAGARRHILLLDIKTGDTRPLTHGDQDYWLPAWSPDGKSIAYVTKAGPDADRTMNSDVYIMAVDGNSPPKQISTFEGTDADLYWASPPAWSPDGRKLAWLQSGESKWIYYAPWQLTVADLKTGTVMPLARADRNFYMPKWSADGTALFALMEENRSTYLVRVDSTTGAITRLSDGKRFALDYAASANGKLVLLDSTDTKPFELYAVEGGLRPLTHHNAWLEDVQLAETEEFSFDSDGHQIDGFIVRPVGAVKGVPLPTIFRLHGGPVYQFSHEFMSDWQIYAAAGYAVVGINPRGSSGKGFDFARSIYANWGHVDVADILAGTDHMVNAGITDPTRMAVGGWSYGGMLTNYVIGTDTRFKAAISGAGTANMYGMYGHDQYTGGYELELGTPWQNPEAYARVSFPFLHADKITTPTLYQCSEKDFNVPCLGAEQMYQALKSVGTETQLVIYPGQHHGISVPSYLHDRMQRNLNWYGHYIGTGASE
ncbi:alpha/beta hydrolase family protein [Kordiimonas pumila]|uniref:Prolyl oligopeptidase family serine peptidase n=1 Tax=Kordiimonas pumila TaxID=2161677 RepID=A0ABV7D3J3_9PROT|nr:S9 family peptidase [Kordiimonas pumila]